jgi:hypothetical protein
MDIMQLAMGYQLLHEEKMESLAQYFEDRHFTGKVVKVVRHNFKGNKDFPPELLKKLGLQ